MIRLVIALLFGLMFVAPANAQERPVFSKQQAALLNVAQDYLARVKTVRANFVQINPGTSVVSSGEIFIAKPGKLKMAYASPFAIDYYVNGDNLMQYDHDLDEVTRAQAPENPLKILLYDDISLTRNDLMDVTNVVDDRDNFSVFLLNKTEDVREITGLILRFRKTPTELLGIERVDNEGNKTETSLTSIKVNGRIEDSVFAFKRPKAAFPNSRKN